MTDTTDLRVTFVRSPSFAAASASSVTVTGPTADGMIHMHFVRDTQILVAENYLATPVHNADGNLIGQSLVPKPPGEVANHKELVATMSVPVHLIGNIGAALVELAKQLNVEGVAAPIHTF